MSAGRCATIGRACELIEWLNFRRAEFTKHDLARDFHIVDRSALRWLQAAETTGWVDSRRVGHAATQYSSRLRIDRTVSTPENDETIEAEPTDAS